MPRILLFALLALVGCGGTTTQPVPSSTGDFVDNQNGVGTAKVFGVDFRVLETSGGASAENVVHLDGVNPDQSEATQKFSFGDDVTILLESIDESKVHFHLNDEDYGVLQVGDEVVIDEDRNVEVNGSARPMNSDL